jgi:hypothetical protein
MIQANELNSNKAINAYFEGQRAGPPAEVGFLRHDVVYELELTEY